MDLDLDLHRAVKGSRTARSQPVTLVTEGELTREDLEALREAPPRNTVPSRDSGVSRIKRLRERHHALARQIASGIEPRSAAFAIGYTTETVRILMADPAFQELVSHYRDEKDAAMADLFERMSGLSIDAVEELRQRIEDEPETFTNTQLLELLKGVADRTGHAPVQKSQNLHVHANLADRLAEARKRLSRVTEPDEET